MNKTKLLFIALTILSFSAHSQITKGNWLLGGNVTYSSINSSSDLSTGLKTTTFKIDGKVGYFVWDKIALGLKPNLFVAKDLLSNMESKGTNLTLGPFVRYYFLPIEQSFNFFLEGSYGWGFSKYNNSDQVFHSHQYGFAGGPILFLNSSVALELLVSYDVIHLNEQSHEQRKTISAGVGLQFHLERDKK